MWLVSRIMKQLERDACLAREGPDNYIVNLKGGSRATKYNMYSPVKMG